MTDKQLKFVKRSLYIAMLLLFPAAAAQAASSSVHLEELTWMEVRDRLRSGATTAIIPTGGTEQNGPHMVLGKHNMLVRYTAGEIARQLGNALVAPVIAYVPEGRINPPEGHMAFPGTISVSTATFAALLEDTARSLKQHGFRLICFIGDSGGDQAAQSDVARRLNEEWRGLGVKVLHVTDYYANNNQQQWGESMGLKVPDPGAHAGHIDTSELLALNAQGVRTHALGVRSPGDYRATGAAGDSSQASANYGRRYLSLKIQAAVNQIHHATQGAQ